MYIQTIPPTPTPFSGAEYLPDLDAPEAWLWDAAPDTVGLWNSANQSGFMTLVQVFAIGVMVMIFIGLLLMVVRQLGNNG